MSRWEEYCISRDLSPNVLEAIKGIPEMYAEPMDDVDFVSGKIIDVCVVDRKATADLVREDDESPLLCIEYEILMLDFSPFVHCNFSRHREVILIFESVVLDDDFQGRNAIFEHLHEEWLDESLTNGTYNELNLTNEELNLAAEAVREHHWEYLTEDYDVDNQQLDLPDDHPSEIVRIYEEACAHLQSESDTEDKLKETHPYWDVRSLNLESDNDEIKFTIEAWNGKTLIGEVNEQQLNCRLISSGAAKVKIKEIQIAHSFKEDVEAELKDLIKDGWLDEKISLE